MDKGGGVRKPFSKGHPPRSAHTLFAPICPLDNGGGHHLHIRCQAHFGIPILYRVTDHGDYSL